MTALPADADLMLPPRRVRRALDLPDATHATMRQRGQLEGLLAPDPRGRSCFTMRGFLALAAYRAFAEQKIEPPRELRLPSAFLMYADWWLATRGTARPVREAVFRWYGRPGAEDSTFQRAMNEDALATQPRPGARITLRLNLDAIFGEAERALLDEPQPGRTEEEILGLAGDE